MRGTELWAEARRAKVEPPDGPVFSVDAPEDADAPAILTGFAPNRE